MDYGNIQALIADLDGTLAVKGQMPGPLTLKALGILHDHGIQLGIASGRVINEALKRRSVEWNLPFQFDVLIGMNGGQVLITETDEFYEEYALSRETLKEIMVWMEPLGLIASLYEGDHMVATAIDELQAASARRNNMEIIDSHGDLDRLCRQPCHTLIYRYTPDKEKQVKAYIADYLNAHPDTEYTSVNPSSGIVEIVHKKCCKGVGVQVYSRNSGIPAAQILGMGDMDNDLTLITECGIGVALENGSDTLKAAADAVTEYPCSEDGAGRFLFEHWIKPLGWD